jgi:hypothetical protein
MADTGAPWNLAYPLSSDLVKDGALAIQDLAEDVAAGLDVVGVGIGTNAVSTFTNTTATFSATSTGSQSSNLTGLATSITPTSASSKVLLIAALQISGDNRPANIGINLLRGTTAIARGTGGTYNITAGVAGTARNSHTNTIVFLDSPGVATSVTYNFRFINLGDIGQTIYLNRGSSSSVANAGSTVTLIEVRA